MKQKPCYKKMMDKEYINYPFWETSVTTTTRKKNHSETKNQLSTHEEKN
jgi:hypothetical protein